MTTPEYTAALAQLSATLDTADVTIEEITVALRAALGAAWDTDFESQSDADVKARFDGSRFDWDPNTGKIIPIASAPTP